MTLKEQIESCKKWLNLNFYPSDKLEAIIASLRELEQMKAEKCLDNAIVLADKMLEVINKADHNQGKCRWTKQGFSFQTSECGKMFRFEDRDGSVKYCPNCSKEIEWVKE